MKKEDRITLAKLKKGQTLTHKQMSELVFLFSEIGRELTDREVKDCLDGKPISSFKKN